MGAYYRFANSKYYTILTYTRQYMYEIWGWVNIYHFSHNWGNRLPQASYFKVAIYIYTYTCIHIYIYIHNFFPPWAEASPASQLPGLVLASASSVSQPIDVPRLFQTGIEIRAGYTRK